MPDLGYKSFPIIFGSKGLSARFVNDKVPPEMYQNLQNSELRQENALSSRFGRKAITTDGASMNYPLPAAIHTLGRLKSLDDVAGNAVTYRYAGAGAKIYRRTGDTQGQFSDVTGTSAFSGKRMSLVYFKPDFSSVPYVFFADKSFMAKDNGSLAQVQQMGIFPPTIPVTAAITAPSELDIELFNGPVGNYTVANYGGASIIARINTTLTQSTTAGSVQQVTVAAVPEAAVGSVVTINAGGGTAENVIIIASDSTTITAYFANAHANGETVTCNSLSGTVTEGTTATISRAAVLDLSKIGLVSLGGTDLVNIFMEVSDPSTIQEIRVIFDVNDGSFSKDYYYASIAPSALQSAISGGATTSAAIYDQAYSNQIQNRILQSNADGGIGESFVIPPPISPTAVWTALQIQFSSFLKVGNAGLSGRDWSDVKAWRISVIMQAGAATATFAVSDLYVSGAAGPDVFAGSAYDYRVTNFNVNTGAESNGSPVMIPTNFVSPRRQPVAVAWQATSDSQGTHYRIYRRGGTLPSAWYRIGQVAVGTTTILDNLSDSWAQKQNTLALDNDPPVTSTLQTPVITTLGTTVAAGGTHTATPASMSNIYVNQVLRVGTGDTEEEVIVQSKTNTTFNAFFQYAHSSNEAVYAGDRVGRPVGLAASAFNKLWLAGDPDNPHILYYSKTSSPEAFPPQNFIEVGTPNDPIMALAELGGQLYVFTMARIYMIWGTGTVPYPLPTYAKHGLVASFGWCKGPGAIWYRSNNGIYTFRSVGDQKASEIVDWLLNGQTYGPIIPADTTKSSDDTMCWWNNLMFHSYTDTNGTKRRLIWEDPYQRWRNDDQPATAMLYEEDTGTLLFGDRTGMVYQDRINDFDDGGWNNAGQIKNPIAVSIDTGLYDQQLPENPKVYQEVTVTCDTKGQDIDVYLLFDNGTVATKIGTVNCVGRQILQLPPINNGLGRQSYNIGFRFVGNVTSAVYFYEASAMVAVEVERRHSFDSYWLRYGTDEFKVMKQGWFEYCTYSSGTVLVQCFQDGSSTESFHFTLPDTGGIRKAARIRFPGSFCQMNLVRWVMTSTQDFQLYGDSQIEVKYPSINKGWQRIKLATEG